MRTLFAAALLLSTVNLAAAECWEPSYAVENASETALTIRPDALDFFGYYGCLIVSTAHTEDARIFHVGCGMEGEITDSVGEERMTVTLTPHGYGYAYLQFDDNPPELWRRCKHS